MSNNNQGISGNPIKNIGKKASSQSVDADTNYRVIQNVTDSHPSVGETVVVIGQVNNYEISINLELEDDE